MKVCPKCGSFAADEAQSFCLIDGTPLVPDVSSEPTVTIGRTEPTMIAAPRKKRTGMWVALTIFGLLVLGLVIGGLMFAAYRMGTQSVETKVSVGNNAQSPRPSATPKQTPGNCHGVVTRRFAGGTICGDGKFHRRSDPDHVVHVGRHVQERRRIALYLRLPARWHGRRHLGQRRLHSRLVDLHRCRARRKDHARKGRRGNDRIHRRTQRHTVRRPATASRRTTSASTSTATCFKNKSSKTE